jgi:hypothetical protein
VGAGSLWPCKPGFEKKINKKHKKDGLHQPYNNFVQLRAGPQAALKYPVLSMKYSL